MSALSDTVDSEGEGLEFHNESDYRAYLADQAMLPSGFRVGTSRLSFVPSERPTLEPYRMNLSLMLLDKPTSSFGGVFTRNAFPGAPVILAREKMEEELLGGVLVNNKIANVRAATGIRDARRLTSSLAKELDRQLGIDESGNLLSVSTGIIGWKLPVPEMEQSLPELVGSLHGGSALDVADAIMTTDAFPKARRAQIGEGTILGIAKGAGMIEPNMATMLVFLLTDITISRDTLRGMLREAVDSSFNAISVDSDMSTSDMALLISSCAKPAVSESAFGEALRTVCRQLAGDVVRNGEGTAHVMRVTVSGMPNDQTAQGAAKAIVNSPLVKTAVYGNDPNVGRILSSLGDFAGDNGIELQPERVKIDVGSETVFRDGAFDIDREKEMRLSDYLKSASLNPRLTGYPQHQRSVAITVECGAGPGTGYAIGADLSDQYVRENADYRT